MAVSFAAAAGGRVESSYPGTNLQGRGYRGKLDGLVVLKRLDAPRELGDLGQPGLGLYVSRQSLGGGGDGLGGGDLGVLVSVLDELLSLPKTPAQIFKSAALLNGIGAAREDYVGIGQRRTG